MFVGGATAEGDATLVLEFLTSRNPLDLNHLSLLLGCLCGVASGLARVESALIL
jgi:hypothetical protein